ncbi:MAG: substrate-binding domain-containing protein [Deltaproteobacteria bacterium]|jgi:AI-2 transport system substrate-binding protein|nr:substrate-binding domain-containing protein [Deltaproteobacteria bacterium]
MKKHLTVILAVFVSVTFFSCRGGGERPVEPADGITVVFVPKVTGNSFFEVANQGAQEYGARHGFKVDYRGSPVAEVAEQRKIVEDAIKNKIRALSISSLDSTALNEVLKRAKNAGMKITTWDSDVAGDSRYIMISQGTPAQLGRMLVEMGAKSLEKRGKHPVTNPIKYAWHYSQAMVADQNSWRDAGEEYIKTNYPNWENVHPDNYYSFQDPEKALEVGRQILAENPDIDLIILNDSTSLPAQAKVLKELGKTSEDLTITGFSPPNAMREYAKEGIIDRWGLWDCKVQGALATYISYYLASGNQLNVGQMIDIPDVGLVEIMPNTVLDPDAYTAPDSGVILLPKRTEFTLENVDDYDF